MDPRLVPLLQDQAGVVSRAQAHAVGLQPHDIARLVRRRMLCRLHPAVYLNHTGEPTWLQRAWGGVLLCWPAALAGETALRAVEGPGSRRAPTTVQVVVAADRRVRGTTGVDVRRTRHLEERVLWHTGPPRLRYEEALVDVVSTARSDLAAVAELARAVQSRCTTADRLIATLDRRERVRRKRFIRSVLADVAAGTCSVLEHGYLHRVERAHRLQAARRQSPTGLASGAVYRDVEYDCGLVVELDGRLFHDTAEQRDRDFDRDLETAAGGRTTVRLTYGQVFDRPCWTAGQVAALLRARGWPGEPTPCGDRCTVDLRWR